MGYAKRLQKQFSGLSELGGNELQKRRDKLSKAGYAAVPMGSGFSTTVRGKQKQKGSSKVPNGYPSRNSQFGG